MLTPFFLSPAQAAAAASGQGDSFSRTMPTCSSATPQAYAKFFRAMLDRGIMLPPSQFEAWFVSTAHTEGDIDQTLDAAKDAFAAAAAK